MDNPLSPEDQDQGSEQSIPTATTAAGSTLSRKELRLKKRRRGQALLASGLALLVIAGGGAAYYALGTEVVPNAATSHSALDKENPCDDFSELKIGCKLSLAHSDGVPRDGLISQSPEAGFHIFKSSGPVNLVYSSGPAKSKFPDILRQDYDSSVKELYLLGIEIGDVKTVEKDDLEANRIVSASIEPGSTVKSGTKVNLEVSAETVKLPDLKGLTREQAELDLEKLGLDSEIVEEQSSEAAGTVVGQSPSQGQVAKSSKVTVKVAKPEEIKSIKVPSVVGLKEDEAQGVIASAGFTNITVVKVESSKVTEARVSNVAPGEGRSVRSDSNVVIVVSIPETK